MEIGRNRWWRALAAATALAMVAVACGDDNGADTDEDGEVAEGGEPGTLTMLHAISGEDEAAGLRAALEAFTEETGITVQETASADFEQLARSRVEGGNPPDIVVHPQPGLMRDLIDQDLAFPADDLVDVAQLEDDLIDGLVSDGQWNDQFYGLAIRLSLKSLVWYVPERFDEHGYEVPGTWEEMVALADQMRDDGNTPWCIGIEASDATGWVATDWVEDIMLRVHGPDVYDAWTANELPFDSPEVIEAMEDYFAPLWFTDGNVFGGTPNILQTAYGESVNGLFNEQCFLHRQASFITSFMPDGTTVGEDVAFFYLPEIEASGQGAPVLIAGDLAVAYTDNPSIGEFFQFFAQPGSGEPWAAEGAWLSPFEDFDSSVYPDEFTVDQAELVTDADFARFDGSDMMPGAVGAGAFWTEMVNYIQRGGEGLEQSLSSIDAAWPD